MKWNLWVEKIEPQSVLVTGSSACAGGFNSSWQNGEHKRNEVEDVMIIWSAAATGNLNLVSTCRNVYVHGILISALCLLKWSQANSIHSSIHPSSIAFPELDPELFRNFWRDRFSNPGLTWRLLLVGLNHIECLFLIQRVGDSTRSSCQSFSCYPEGWTQSAFWGSSWWLLLLCQ